MLVCYFVVDLEDKPSEKIAKVSNSVGSLIGSSSSGRDQLGSESKESAWQVKDNVIADGQKVNVKEMSHSPVKSTSKERGKSSEDSGNGPDIMVQNNSSSLKNLGKPVKRREKDSLDEASELLLDAASDPTLPTEVIMYFYNALKSRPCLGF